VFNGEFVTGDKRVNKSINTRNYELFRTSNLHEWYERHVIEPTLALEEFQERGSGWELSRILDLTVNVNRYNLSYACRMLCEITARHNDEESGDQRAIDGQCVLRMVGGGRSVSS